MNKKSEVGSNEEPLYKWIVAKAFPGIGTFLLGIATLCFAVQGGDILEKILEIKRMSSETKIIIEDIQSRLKKPVVKKLQHKINTKKPQSKNDYKYILKPFIVESSLSAKGVYLLKDKEDHTVDELFKAESSEEQMLILLKAFDYNP